MGWIQKSEIDDELLPVPTQIVSNEEFEPPDQTEDQAKVQHRVNEIADSTSNSPARLTLNLFWSFGISTASVPISKVPPGISDIPAPDRAGRCPAVEIAQMSMRSKNLIV